MTKQWQGQASVWTRVSTRSTTPPLTASWTPHSMVPTQSPSPWGGPLVESPRTLASNGSKDQVGEGTDE
jgi:hypothetical protein